MTRIMAAALAVSVAACSSPPSQKRLVDEAVAAMGGRAKLQGVQILTMSGGAGSRWRLNQTVHVGDPESPAELKDVVEIVDLVNGRASLDYELKLGDFGQHRHEILTRSGEGVTSRSIGIEIVGTRPIVATTPGGLFSWGTQNSPEFVLRRNIIGLALAAVPSASDAQPAQNKALNGKMYSFANTKTKTGEDVGLYVDPQSKLIAAFEVTDTETMLGDVPAQYVLTDYRVVDGLTLPHHITIRKGGKDYSDVQFASLTINDPKAAAVFAIPAAAAKEADVAAAEADYTPLALEKVAEGVYFARAYSHNSLVVVFPTFISVAEAPYTETQSKVLARLIQEQFPGKPIRYVAITHHHYDHTGGVRGIAASGATLIAEKRHYPAIQELVDARHTQPQDELDKVRGPQPATKPVVIEIFEEKKVISEGSRSLELYAITGSPHADPMVIAYVPDARVLFQSDLWFPGTGGTGNPLAKHLLDSVRKLGLNVETNVGGHGSVAPFSELVTAVAKMQAPAAN